MTVCSSYISKVGLVVVVMICDDETDLFDISLSLCTMTSLGLCVTAALRAFDAMCRMTGDRRRHHVKLGEGWIGVGKVVK